MPRPRSEAVEGKPPLSYVSLCTLAIIESPQGKLALGDIYEYIRQRYPYYRESSTWKNSLRHNLSYNDCFIRVSRDQPGKGSLWTMHPQADKMFENGTMQRRRKRFKVSDQSKEQIALSDETTQYKTPDNSELQFLRQRLLRARQQGSFTLVAETPSYNCYSDEQQQQLQREQQHQEKQWQQQEQQQQEQQQQTPEREVQPCKKIKNKLVGHLAVARDKIKLAFTIDNLMLPDSPKRKKKKVYTCSPDALSKSPEKSPDVCCQSSFAPLVTPEPIQSERISPVIPEPIYLHETGEKKKNGKRRTPKNLNSAFQANAALMAAKSAAVTDVNAQSYHAHMLTNPFLTTTPSHLQSHHLNYYPGHPVHYALSAAATVDRLPQQHLTYSASVQPYYLPDHASRPLPQCDPYLEGLQHSVFSTNYVF